MCPCETGLLSCIGYNYPEDPYVLKGSCGLEYKLFYTNIKQTNKNYMYNNNYNGQQWSSKGNTLFFPLCILSFDSRDSTIGQQLLTACFS